MSEPMRVDVRMLQLPEYQPPRGPYVEVGARGLGLAVAVGEGVSVLVERFEPTGDGTAVYVNGPRKGQRVERNDRG